MDIKIKLAKYINDNLEVNFQKAKYNYDASCECSAMLEECEFSKRSTFFESKKEAKISGNRIDTYIDDNKDDNKFQKLLFKYIDNKDLKDSDVYNKVNIDRRLFSKIRSDSNYHPSKETIILLAISLELNEDELIDLLNSASYSLPNNDVFNLIIKFCFKEGIYNLDTINEYLYQYNCKLIGVNN